MRYKKFEDVKINRTEIPQKQLNLDLKTKSNPFAWNGQFSPQFVDVMIKKYVKQNQKIIDPFLGSGTSILEASLFNIDVCGIELNPAAFYLASIYRLCNSEKKEREALIKLVEDRYLKSEIKLDAIMLDEKDEQIKNVITVLIMLDESEKSVNGDIYHSWSKLKSIILSLPVSKNHIKIINADSRNVELEHNYYDVMITSPPYVNVYNYHQQYRDVMEGMGHDILNIAISEIGSNRKNRGNRFLSVIQYCIDITLLLNNIIYFMKDEARFIFVIGRCSSVLGVTFSNSRLLYDILVRIFRCNIILRQERYFTNRYGQEIYEDILHFKCNKSNIGKEAKYYVSYAKKIASQYLCEKLREMEGNHPHHELLEYTLSQVNKIEASR